MCAMCDEPNWKPTTSQKCSTKTVNSSLKLRSVIYENYVGLKFTTPKKKVLKNIFELKAVSFSVISHKQSTSHSKNSRRSTKEIREFEKGLPLAAQGSFLWRMKLFSYLLAFTCYFCATSKNSYASGVIQSKDSVRQLVTSDETTTNLRGSEDPVKFDPNEPIRGDTATIGLLKEIIEEKEFDNYARTATGGIVNTIMVALTVFAFLGNGAFMVYVFWLSK